MKIENTTTKLMFEQLTRTADIQQAILAKLAELLTTPVMPTPAHGGTEESYYTEDVTDQSWARTHHILILEKHWNGHELTIIQADNVAASTMGLAANESLELLTVLLRSQLSPLYNPPKKEETADTLNDLDDHPF
jgi:hypothetical protein